MIYLVSYVTLSFFFVAGFFAMGYRSGDIDKTKEDILMTIMCVLLCPISVIVFFAAVFHIQLEARRREACYRALVKWENRAKEGYEHAWDWYVDKKKKELRYNLMRETVGCLSNKELHLLVSTSEKLCKIEKHLKDTVMDEIVDRELKKL